MTVELITKQDLINLKEEIIAELRQCTNANFEDKPLKSAQVKEILKCSDSTLQKHRIYGRLPFTKVGGTYYYTLTDINSLLKNSIKN